MNYEMKNMKEIKIEDGELILIWESGQNCATQMRFAINDIYKIGIDLKGNIEGETTDDRK